MSYYKELFTFRRNPIFYRLRPKNILLLDHDMLIANLVSIGKRERGRERGRRGRGRERGRERGERKRD